MFRTFADFFLGVALARRDGFPVGPTPRPMHPTQGSVRHQTLGWMARVGTW
ncbi:MAG: hypothetical protein AAFY65_02105 [Pseudomonadota bacterium]